MKTLSSFRRQAKICVCLVFMIILAWNPPSYANSSSLPKEAKSNFIRQVREIETAELGIPHPAGLAFSPAANVFQVMTALPLDQPLPQSTDLTTVTPFEDAVGMITILADNPDPINMVFDGVNDRLLILQPSGSKAIVVPAGPAEGNLLSDKLSKHDIGRWGLKNPRGMTIDPASGQIFVLDLSGPRLVKIVPAANGGLEDAAVTAVDLKFLNLHNPQGLAFDPVTGHLHLLSRTEQKLCELTQSGQIVANRDLSPFGFSDPQAMVIAPSSDMTDDPQQMSLYLADSGQNVKNTRVGRIVELTFVQPAAVAASSYTSALIHTIDTSKFSKPSPDPCGLTITSSDKLLICDSEVEEMTIWNGVNLFETTLSGSQIRMASTTSFTNEPTGVVRNPANQHLFFSDDDRKKIFEMNPGADGLPGTSDDIITSFRTSTFGSNDPEDVTFAATSGSLFVVDGVNREVYQVQPGANGRFDGVSPDGDDRVTSFDTASLGVLDPEGIDFNSTTGHLYVVGKPATAMAELTTAGTLVQMIDISAADALKPAGLTSGPGSVNPAARVMYVADRRVDNNDNPNENDGKVYELSLPSDTPDTPPNVAINSPINNTTYTSGTSISFSGSALDAPDGDLSAGLNWTSSLDGPIGSGAAFSKANLSVGTHTITAAVTDSSGLSGSDQVTITVTEIANTAPVVTITSPADGNFYTVGTSISFSGSALDVPDGDLSAGLSWTSSLDGPIGSGAAFSKDSLSVGTHTVTAAVADSEGHNGSAQVTITVTPLQSSYSFSPSADAKVVSSTPSTNYGPATKLEERVSSDTRRGYLKFDVTGLSGTVKSARMRVYCLKTFSGGDSAYLVSNNYQGTTDPWTESGLNWNNAPSLPGTYLSKVAPVTANTWVEFDVTAAVTGNGVYSFALAHNATTLTYYNTKEAAQNRPVLVIETQASADTPPNVAISSPINNTTYTVGTSISFSGSALDVPDGDLSAGLNWTSSLDGPIGSGAAFSKANLSVGTHTITAAVTDSSGLSGSAQVTITVTEIPITAPVVTITSPADGNFYTVGTSISFSGSALDVPDGDLSAGLSWTSSLDGPIGSGAAFSKDSLSVGTHTVTAAVADSEGHNGSAQVTITVTPLQSSYSFSPSADAKVISSTPSTNYGPATKLEERVSSDTRRGYLKFDVTGLSGTVKSARMRVYCLKTFSGGDSAYLVSNNYQGTTNPWTESGLNWNNAPSLPGTYLSKVAPVTANTWVEFDVTAAVTGNGVYSFALAHNATTLTYYNTKEAAQNRPVLVIETL